MENTLMSITKKYVTQMKGPERTWIPCCSCNTLFHAVVNLSHKTLIQRLRFVLLVFTQFDLNHLFMIGRLTRLTASCCYSRKSASWNPSCSLLFLLIFSFIQGDPTQRCLWLSVNHTLSYITFIPLWYIPFLRYINSQIFHFLFIPSIYFYLSYTSIVLMILFFKLRSMVLLISTKLWVMR